MYKPQQTVKTMLALASQAGIPLTNLSIQKLLYLAHGLSLAKDGKALVDEPFQAWKYGPVMESLYHDLKVFGSSPVQGNSWYVKSWPEIPADDIASRNVIQSVLDQCGRMSAGQLIELTHDKQGPWHAVFNSQEKGIAIEDEAIKAYFETITANKKR